MTRKLEPTREQARWLLEQLQECIKLTTDERKPYDTDSDVKRYALARFQGMLQAWTGDWR